MFAYGETKFKGFRGFLWLSLLIAALISTGCGFDDGSGPDGTQAAAAGTTTEDGTAGGEVAPGADTAGADAGDLEVITAWIDALSEGDTDRAATFFATPSVAENGPLVAGIETTRDAVAFNESLPCGGEVIAAESTGQFTTATFRLTERPGGGCGEGIGGTAATSFLIEDNLITEWRRVGTDPARGSSEQSTT